MKVPKALQAACRVLRHRVQYRTASLRLPGTPYGQDDTNAIREATRLYVRTWVLPLIDAIERGDMATLNELTYTQDREPMPPCH